MKATALLQPLVRLVEHELALVRIASRSKADTQRCLSTNQRSYKPVPDFLLPCFVAQCHYPSAISNRPRPPLQLAPASPGHLLQRRTFSSSSAAHATVVTANPRKDEDGNEMLVDITARAANVCSFRPSRLHTTMTANNGPASQRDHVKGLQP